MHLVRMCVFTDVCHLISSLLGAYRKKLQSKLAESEEATSAVQSKLTSLEKTKNRIASELDDTGYALDDMRNQVAAMEKSKKKFDAGINDWKAKYDARGQELDTSQRDARGLSTEVETRGGEGGGGKEGGES